MPTFDWLKREFSYGYDSGNILSLFPNKRRRDEERLVGGSYKRVFRKALRPYLKQDSRVLELGPGKGAWSRAILNCLAKGELHTVDFQDTTQWLQPEKYKGRLVCHTIIKNADFSFLPDSYFDVAWSFGVLCHNNASSIAEVLAHSLPKIKPGGHAIHEYGDWEKLERYGWKEGGVPPEFRNMADDDIWWPRNSQATMTQLARSAGWIVITADLDLVRRDSIIVLQRPPAN
jgi:phospholipid N-methyltransferase